MKQVLAASTNQPTFRLIVINHIERINIMRLHEIADPKGYSLPDTEPAHLVRQIERTQPDNGPDYTKSSWATPRKTKRPVLRDTK
jgi:hypothetical protein